MSPPRPVDDRGKLYDLAPPEVLEGALWERTPRRVWKHRARYFALVAVAFAYLIWRQAWQYAFFSPWMLLGIPLGVVVWIVMCRKPPRLPLPGLLAAHRRCGACAYNLHETAPEQDGCVVCPECGAAWHQDRFTLAVRDAAADSYVAKVVAWPMPYRYTLDDRGVPTKESTRWPTRWFRKESAPNGVSEDLRQCHQQCWTRSAIIGAYAAVATWVVSMSITLILLGRSYVEVVALSCILVFVVAVLVLKVVSQIVLGRRMRRAVIDRFGVCLACGDALPADVPPTFDGCVACRACGRAWKRA
jgi:hypothetical protein